MMELQTFKNYVEVTKKGVFWDTKIRGYLKYRFVGEERNNIEVVKYIDWSKDFKPEDELDDDQIDELADWARSKI